MNAETVYLFRHSMLRDAAYQLQLPSARARLHGLVVDIVQALNMDAPGALALELADHARSARLGNDSEQDRAWVRREAALLREGIAYCGKLNRQRVRGDALIRLHALNLDEPREQARHLAEAAECFDESGDVRRALSTAQLAAAAAEAAALPEVALEQRLRVARLLSVQGQSSAALEMFEAVRSEGERSGQTRTLAKCLLDLGYQRHRNGQSAEAQTALDQAGRIAEKLKDPAIDGLLASHRGMLLADHGDYAAARKQLEFAHKLALREGSKTRLATTYSHLSNIYSWLGKRVLWERCNEAALLVNREIGNLRGLMVVIGNRGIAEREAGDFERALASYREAELLAREMGVPYSIAVNLTNQGTVLGELGRCEEALARNDEAMKIAKSIGAKPIYAMAVYHRGCALRDAGRREEASEVLTSAVALLEELGNAGYMGYALVELSDLKRYLGKLDEALSYTDRALAVGKAAGEPALTAFALARRARILVSAGRHAEAERDAHDALKHFDDAQGNRRYGHFLAYFTLARIEAARGHGDEALSFLRRIVEVSGKKFMEETDEGREAQAMMAGIEAELGAR